MKIKVPLSLLYLLAVVALHTLNLGDAVQWNEDHLGPFRTDLVVHFLMFLPWAFFAARVWEPGSMSIAGVTPYLALMITGIIFAVAMETTQAFLPYRTFSGLDMLMNAMSTGTGYLLRSMFPSAGRSGNG